ncbi:uncharacterized protein LOC129948311 [Eupeodes corollae]|uniref:uncharacterized protein LOC129948311 n=1 Tax=Eupeodes corollae TaxID=290404 RepID=UPI002490E5F5|nr:uncharacterized protein LOC129948311 [Eupeodes corollae]
MDYEHSEFLALSSASSNSLTNLNKTVDKITDTNIDTNDKINNNISNTNNNIETCSSPIDNSSENMTAAPQFNFNSRSYSSSNSDEVSSAAPRNALFSCSTPVCLKLTTLPQFIPIDYQGQESSTSTSSMSSSSGSSSVRADSGVGSSSSSIAGGSSNNNHLLITTTTTTTENVNPDPDGKGGQDQTTTKTTTTTTTTAIPVSVPDLAKLDLTSPNGIVFKSGDLRMTMSELDKFVESAVAETLAVVEGKDKPKPGHKVKTPPPVGVNLGVTLKRVTPPKTQISVKNGPMLGVVLRKVEKKVEPQKSILDDDKPLYHLSIVRTGGDSPTRRPKPKLKPKLPKPVPLQKVATIGAIPITRPSTTAAAAAGKSSTAAAGGASATAAAKPPVGATAAKPGVPPSGTALQKTKSAHSIRPARPQPGVPITIQKIEGDKIIIIKKIQIPKNSKVPENFIPKVGCVLSVLTVLVVLYRRILFDLVVDCVAVG